MGCVAYTNVGPTLVCTQALDTYILRLCCARARHLQRLTIVFSRFRLPERFLSPWRGVASFVVRLAIAIASVPASVSAVFVGRLFERAPHVGS